MNNQNIRAYCYRCGQPIYDNVDIDISTPWHNEDGSISKRDQETKAIDVICPDCTLMRVAGVQKKEQDSPLVKGKAFSPGERLRRLRKKLRWSQGRLAEHFGLKSKSAIARYENDKRKIPEGIKAWIGQTELMLHKKSGKEVSESLKSGKFSQEKLPKKAELMAEA